MPVQTTIAVQDGQTTVAEEPRTTTGAGDHEAMRLFTPAPEQMPGQMDMRPLFDETA
jgi:hypothetical protein